MKRLFLLLAVLTVVFFCSNAQADVVVEKDITVTVPGYVLTPGVVVGQDVLVYHPHRHVYVVPPRPRPLPVRPPVYVYPKPHRHGVYVRVY